MRLDEIAKKNRSFAPNLKPWMFQTKEEIEEWLKKANIDGIVSRELEVHITDMRTIDIISDSLLVKYNGKNYLPVRFHITTNFDISHSKLNSLEGCPMMVLGDFLCRNGSFEDFAGAPKMIKGLLRGSTKVSMRGFYGLEDTKVDAISFGATPHINAYLETINGLPAGVKELTVFGIKSLSGIHKICPDLENLYLGRNIGSAVLGVLLLKNLKFFNFTDLNDSSSAPLSILDKHVNGDADVLDCQEELILNGFKEHAKL